MDTDLSALPRRLWKSMNFDISGFLRCKLAHTFCLYSYSRLDETTTVVPSSVLNFSKRIGFTETNVHLVTLMNMSNVKGDIRITTSTTLRKKAFG